MKEITCALHSERGSQNEQRIYIYIFRKRDFRSGYTRLRRPLAAQLFRLWVESTRKMEGDETRLTFESPLFGEGRGGTEDETSKMDGNGKGRDAISSFTERNARSSMETGTFSTAFHFQIPRIPEPRDSDHGFFLSASLTSKNFTYRFKYYSISLHTRWNLHDTRTERENTSRTGRRRRRSRTTHCPILSFFHREITLNALIHSGLITGWKRNRWTNRNSVERWIIVGEKEVDLDDGTRVRLERCPTPLSLRSLPDRNLFASKSARVACQRSASTGVCRGTRAPEGQVFAAHVYRMRDDDTSMNHTPSFVRFTRPPLPLLANFQFFRGKKFPLRKTRVLSLRSLSLLSFQPMQVDLSSNWLTFWTFLWFKD